MKQRKSAIFAGLICFIHWFKILILPDGIDIKFVPLQIAHFKRRKIPLYLKRKIFLPFFI